MDSAEISLEDQLRSVREKRQELRDRMQQVRDLGGRTSVLQECSDERYTREILKLLDAIRARDKELREQNKSPNH